MKCSCSRTSRSSRPEAAAAAGPEAATALVVAGVATGSVAIVANAGVYSHESHKLDS